MKIAKCIMVQKFWLATKVEKKHYPFITSYQKFLFRNWWGNFGWKKGTKGAFLELVLIDWDHNLNLQLQSPHVLCFSFFEFHTFNLRSYREGTHRDVIDSAKNSKIYVKSIKPHWVSVLRSPLTKGRFRAPQYYI